MEKQSNVNQFITKTNCSIRGIANNTLRPVMIDGDVLFYSFILRQSLRRTICIANNLNEGALVKTSATLLLPGKPGLNF